MTSVTTSVSAGQLVKLDAMVQLNAIVGGNWSYTVDFRLYRDGTLIRTVSETASNAAAISPTDVVSITAVDTVPSTVISTYEVRVIVLVAANIANMTVSSREMNAIVFPAAP